MPITVTPIWTVARKPVHVVLEDLDPLRGPAALGDQGVDAAALARR